eukprot:m.476211 g.476211  ORF g.476211 m.476211 type:complete len:273 (+) comp40347_c0_seq1:1047-1865(+)
MDVIGQHCANLRAFSINMFFNPIPVVPLAQCRQLKTLVVTCFREHGLSDDDVMEFATQCRGLSTIDLASNSVTDASLFALANFVEKAVEVSLDCKLITDRGAIALAERHSTLTKVHLDGPFDTSKGEGVTGRAIRAFVQHCPMLVDVNFSLCNPETDVTTADSLLVELATRCKYLSVVAIEHWNELTDDGLAEFAANCPQLRELWMESCMKVTERGIVSIAHHCPLIETIMCHSDAFSHECAKVFVRKCPYVDGNCILGWAEASVEVILDHS